ncbi:MAG: GIY-YIG nuclease family protein [Yoonia sp.]|uniref:GIY-YIG nuclease family protein n=1 Tax=Yoonia sp. TaxID=2212373 RepID=UPI003299CC63
MITPDVSEFRPSSWIANFGVRAGDPGYIYVIEHLGSIKVGRSVNPGKRLREAKTWIPDIHVLGVKPFWGHREVEDAIHVGLAQFWKQNEWYDFGGDEFFDYFLDEFRAFKDNDINSNSVNFIYMMNGTGMSEFTLAQSGDGTPKSKFLVECSQNR